MRVQSKSTDKLELVLNDFFLKLPLEKMQKLIAFEIRWVEVGGDEINGGLVVPNVSCSFSG